ncbi:MAG: integrin alpha, partial [Candidatus Eisenbacteria bacterium]|nr:integrin alpha [Candidatus Eisenbacteria bacterium]
MFGEQGIRVFPRVGGADPGAEAEAAPEAPFAWRTSRWGRWGRLSEVIPEQVGPRAAGARVLFRYEGFDEWYENGPAGLEQGFTVHERPEGEGVLVVLGRMGGELRPQWSAGDGAVSFLDGDGNEVLHYGGLHAWDASGRELESRLELAGDEIAIVVGDDEADYPVTIDPLLDSPAWQVEGEQAAAQFGFQCATAGDVNGDGYSDVVVSSPYFDAGEEREGRIFLFLGSPDGLATIPSWTAESNQIAAELGQTLGTAGDVNGDGYDDIVAGTWLYDDGNNDTVGAVFLYLGSPSGPGASPDWTALGSDDGAALGLSLSTAGDVNADGFSDLVVGALHYGGQNLGFALVYHGSASGLGATPAWVKTITNPGDGVFGFSVSTAGDVNGDGYGDVIVGSCAYGDVVGSAYVFYGSPTGLYTVHAWSTHSPQDLANYGFAVATAGDVNGDGYSDVMVGADHFDNFDDDEGRVFVYYGSADGLATSVSWWVDGEQAGAQYGSALSSAGDVNGDGYADILIGAMRYDAGGTDTGRAVLYLGSHAGLEGSPAWTTDGAHAQEYLGHCVATAGDANGDGFSDILVGSIGYDGSTGRAQGFYGGPRGLSTAASWIGESNQTSAGFGNAVASAGDVNGDGYSDIVVAASGFDSGQTD